MPLKIRKDSGRIRGRVLRSVIQSIAVIAFVFSPIYQAEAVHSPSEKHFKPSHVTKKSHSTKKQPQATPKSKTKSTVVIPSIAKANCQSGRPMSSLAKASSNSLKKMHEYEALCQSKLFTSSSFFIYTPTTTAQANELAGEVRARLVALQAYGVTPIVFMEPTDPAGRIDMKKYADGSYNGALTTFFGALRSSGISDAQMGTWVPIPEGNIPVWSDISPTVFSASINHVATIQKQHFPRSKTGLLLDTITYPRTDDWSGGSAKSWSPYVTGIKSGLIDSVGVQGFPWVSKANQGAETNGPVSTFLQPQLAMEAAKLLGAKDVWINSGSFAQKYIAPGEKVVRTPQQRLEILNQVIAAARRVQAAGFNAGIHLFAENKLAVAEATNWSYLPSEGVSLEDTEVFKSFASQAISSKIELGLFDS